MHALVVFLRKGEFIDHKLAESSHRRSFVHENLSTAAKSFIQKPFGMNYLFTLVALYSFVQEIDKQPELDTNLYMFNYFVVFVVVGVFVCANLLVGILIKQMLRDGSLTKSLKGSTASLPRMNRSRSISTENLTVNGNENDRVCIRL